MTDMTLICPKCHDTMKSYERNGVTLEQCNECRGIFLDRGELEHLVAAEARYNAAVTGAPAPVAAPPPPAYSEPRYDPRPDPYYDPRHDPARPPLRQAVLGRPARRLLQEEAEALVPR